MLEVEGSSMSQSILIALEGMPGGLLRIKSHPSIFIGTSRLSIENLLLAYMEVLLRDVVGA